jgi:hypothetical protein
MDDEIREICQYYAGKDFDQPREVDVEVLNESQNQWTLDEFVALVGQAAARIPDELLESARVELDAMDDDSKLIISYKTMESAEEVQDRIDRSVQYAKDRLASEREAYERLKRKFG